MTCTFVLVRTGRSEHGSRRTSYRNRPRNGTISTICAYEWDDVDAGVLCRYLNLSQTGHAETLPRNYVYNRSVFGVYCMGYETVPNDCPVDDYDNSNGQCSYLDDAAVRCGPASNGSGMLSFICKRHSGSMSYSSYSSFYELFDILF